MKSSELALVPFAWYDQTIWSHPETLDGMSFIWFPYTKECKSVEELVAAHGADEPEDCYNGWVLKTHADKVLGYVLIDRDLVNRLDEALFQAGGDSADDAVARYKVGYCFGNATERVFFLEDPRKKD